MYDHLIHAEVFSLQLVEKKETCDSRVMVWAAAEKLVEAASEAAFQAGGYFGKCMATGEAYNIT